MASSSRTTHTCTHPLDDTATLRTSEPYRISTLPVRKVSASTQCYTVPGMTYGFCMKALSSHGQKKSKCQHTVQHGPRHDMCQSA